MQGMQIVTNQTGTDELVLTFDKWQEMADGRG